MFDLAIIGAGPGGYTAAEYAAKNGMSVLLFEGRELGGTCLNRGCIPTKALIHSAGLYSEILGAEKYGIWVEKAGFDFEKLHERKNETVRTLRQGIERLMKAGKVTVIAAKACVTGYDDEKVTVSAAGESYEAKHLLIATGSVPSVPPIKGVDTKGVYTSDDLLEGSGKQLDSVIIIGGGVIGCECASIYLSLGAKVTVIEAMEHILPPADKEIAQRLTMLMKKRSAEINVSCKVVEIGGSEGAVSVTYENKKGETCTATAQGVLIATGRKAYTEGLFACENSLRFVRGAIEADESGFTGCGSIYVIGDAKAGNIQLAHVAEAQGKNAVAAMLKKDAAVDMSVVPSCIYTNPEIAFVGLSEDEAKKAGFSVKTAKCLTGANAKCVIESAESGYVKTVTDADTGKLLGAQLICPRATDMVSEFSLALSRGMKTEEIASVIHPHPTFSEMLPRACEV